MLATSTNLAIGLSRLSQEDVRLKIASGFSELLQLGEGLRLYGPLGRANRSLVRDLFGYSRCCRNSSVKSSPEPISIFKNVRRKQITFFYWELTSQQPHATLNHTSKLPSNLLPHLGFESLSSQHFCKLHTLLRISMRHHGMGLSE